MAAGEASACGSAERCESSMACCTGSAAPGYACPGSGSLDPAVRMAGTGRSLVAPAPGPSLGAPADACACVRAGDPAAPGSRPESRAGQDRPEEARGGRPPVVPDARPVAAPARLSPPTGSPPGSPLYLRHARLLI